MYSSIALFTLFAISSLANVLPSRNIDELLTRQDTNHWVSAWTSMPQLVEPDNLPPAPFKSSSAVFTDTTLRQTFRITLPASRIRIQFSNTFGGSDYTVSSASVALPVGGKAGVKDVVGSSILGVTFGGAQSVSVKKGAVTYSDVVDLTGGIKAGDMVSVSAYLKGGQSGTSVTGHPGARTSSWLAQGGTNGRVNDTSLAGTSVLHWYLISAIEAWVPATSSALVILGDSITDGRGSTDNENNRWPDLVLNRAIQAGVTNFSICNQAAGGNAVLQGGLGPTLLSRYTRDAINQPGVKYVMIFEGVNDIGGGATDSSTQTRIGDSLISAFKQITTDAHAKGLLTIGATITPFGGSGQSYSNAEREKTRLKVNNWILKSGGAFDYTVDFGKAVADPAKVSQLLAKYDGGDHLHPNAVGYSAMADAVDLSIFSK